MEMERQMQCYDGDAVATVTDAVNLIVQTAFVTEKSIHWFLFLIGSVTDNAYALYKLLEAENRFPFSDLKKITTPDAECKDDSETENDSDDDDDEDVGGGDDNDNDPEDSSGEEDSDNEQKDADSDSDENDEEDDDDNDENDDDDSDEDDDDDEDEDEEEDNQPPFKKKK